MHKLKESTESDDDELPLEEEDVVCPNCGQSTEGETTCPYCGAILANEDDDLDVGEDEEV